MKEEVEPSLADRFEKIASQYPYRLAVKMATRVFTYHELNGAANRIARAILNRRGPGSEPIALLLEQGIDIIAAIFGVLKAGKFYVAIDPSSPSERAGYILTDTQAGLIVTNQRNAELAQAHTHGRCVSLNIEQLDDFRSDNLGLSILPEDFVTIGYTSGSTGEPKGVVAAHRTVLETTGRTAKRMRLEIEDRLTLLHSLSFGSGYGHLYISLLNGASLFPFDVREEGIDRMGRWLGEEKITIYHSAPALFRQLAESLAGKKKLSNLRLVHLSGAPVTRLDFELYKENFGRETLLEFGMGSTEARGIASAIVDQTFVFPEEGTPIGYPAPHHKILLLDENGSEVGPGERGEIAVKGRNLNPGYWRREDLTRAKFLSDPTGGDERLYLTGDLARMLPDGFLIHMGRKDLMVKIRGFRVEIGEIERALMSHPDVREAAVAAWDRDSAEKYLTGYVVPREDPTLTTEQLREFLKEKLPDYMIPSAFVLVKSLPLTNGKLDRTKLPLPEPKRPKLATPYVCPRTELEGKLACIWGLVLDLDEVGIHDNFFDLGGHSLAATRVISRVIEQFELEIPPQSLFAAPTIAEMAAVIEDYHATQTSLTYVQLVPPRKKRTLAPLSFAQRRLWFLNQLEPESPAYNESSAHRLCGTLNVAALRKALSEIVVRHEVLRTTIGSHDGEPVQVIADPREVELPLVDLCAESEISREEKIRRIITETSRRPFDLSRDYPWRFSLLRLTDQEHILLRVEHHIASDGWSATIFRRELAILYGAFSAGQASPLPELPIQYQDYADWQRRRLQGEILETQLAYWKNQLDGTTPLQLPTDYSRPAVKTFDSAKQSLMLSRDLADRLSALSRQEGVTLFITLLAAFQALLHRYTAQEDIVVGTPIAGRNRIEVENLIGFFVNTLVLRTDFSGNPTFHELLGRVREVTFGAYAHQDLPFEKLVEELQPERTLGNSPLFQVTFRFQNLTKETFELPGLSVTAVELDTGITKFDLALSVREQADGLRAVFEYNTGLFDAATIERMLGHYQSLLEGIVRNPEQRISALELLTEAERHRLLVEWNDTHRDYPGDKCLHELFEDQVEKTPDRVAVVFKEHQLTYRELNSRANQLAHYLRKREVGPEVLVGICIQRSIEMIVGLLGILKAGGAYVPLDPEYPQERLAFMLHDAQVRLLLTQQRLVDKLVEDRGSKPVLSEIEGMKVSDPQSSILNPRLKVVCLDRDWAVIGKESQENPKTETTANNLAYVMYTSGSTGNPKGIEIEHRAIARLLFGVEYAQLDQSQTFLHLAPTSFDASTFEIWGALLHGAKCVLYSGTVPAPKELGDLVRKHGVSTLWLTASLFNVVIDEAAEALSGIGQLLVGGEALSVSHVRSALSMLPHTQIVNGYGPTESTTFTCCYSIPRNLGESVNSIPIGRPIGNTKVYILDQHLNLVPIGVAGELYIGGDGLARGYYNDPELTAEKFIRNPFSDDAGSRLYRTGDRARFLPDGNIEFLGRTDDQVKIRGYRIELGEIEAVLTAEPGVCETVVLASEAIPGDQRLMAYVVPNQGSAPASDELRALLKKKLPEYMVPSRFVFLEALPLTPNGKIDRKALHLLDQSARQLEQGFVPPRTPVEEIIAKFWEELFKLELVSIHDNFFDLGGHSLLATRLVSRIRRAFQVEFPLRNLFEMPTVAGLAECIEEACRKERGLRTEPIVAVSRDKRLPLSFAQQRLWFLDQLGSNRSIYNVPSRFRLTGPLDVAALQESLNEIVRRHEVLRTNLAIVDGEPVPIISPTFVPALHMVDLSNRSESERKDEVQHIAKSDAQKPFDLAGGPLMRGMLVRLGEEEHVLLLTLHHIACDGWSMEVLYRELAVLYKAFSNGKPSPLPELPLQYADFAVWQRQWLQGEVLDKQLGYWRKQLADLSRLRLPTDRSRPAMQSYRGARQSIYFSNELTQALKSLSRQYGVTLYMTLLAAFQVLLHRHTGQDDIAVGSPIANRNHRDTESLIGFFVNTLVLRSNLAGNPSFAELLAIVRETALEAYTHQDMPFEKLVEELNPERDLGHSPLFQVMFILQNAGDYSLELEGINAVWLRPETQIAKFDLSLTMIERDGALHAAFNYNTDLFEAATIERMLGHFQMLLEGVVKNPDQRISDLPVLTKPERHQLLVEWNDTKTEYPKDKCIHQLFEEQVEKSPDAIAVVFEEEQLTYRELSKRANQLAHYLRKHGVGPDKLVGICVERSMEMVIGLLGILKAGAGYVPLDPSYPAERLEFMLADAQALILLTQRQLLENMVADRKSRIEDGSLRSSIPNPYSKTICLDRDWELIAEASEANPESITTAENLAYVIYTSGSTGLPKGVMIEHRGLVNYVMWCKRAYPLDFGHGAPVHSSLAFDLTVTSLLPPLVTGRPVHLVSESLVSEGLSNALQQTKDFSLVKITPAHLRLLSQNISPEDAQGRTRAFIIGGEELRAEHIAFWQEHAPDTELINEYGPTETVVGCCVYRLLRDEVENGKIPIGRPISNTQLYILDSSYRQPLPIGVTGELYIGGDGIARGYLNRPELTAEKFIPHLFSVKPGARLYRTGDLARYLPDGNIEFLGRADNQVKIRGYRIELGEIEAVLAQHPSIQQAVVLAREDAPGNKCLVAYLAIGDGHTQIIELRDFIKQQLPEYMVPSKWVCLEALPLTTNGKVDRKALHLLDQSRPELEKSFVPPRNPMEEILAEFWKELFKLERVGIHDNFFDLGGHSLLATQLVSKIRDALKLEVPLRAMFETPTVARLAACVQKFQQDEQRGEALPLLRVRRDRALPLSFSQQRLWFLDQLEPGSSVYNVPRAVRIRGPIDFRALELSLNEIVRRHEALRTSFSVVDGEPAQIISPSLKLTVQPINLTDRAEGEREAEARRLAKAEARRPFDLARGPAVRTTLLKLGEDDHVLLLTMHHIVSDAGSMGVLYRELSVLYEAFSNGRPSPLSDLPIQYGDFAVWQRQWLQGAVLERQLSYWKTQLEGIPAIINLPADRPRPAVQSHRGARQSFELSKDLTQALKTLSRKHHVTLLMTLLAAFQTLLHRYSGQHDFVIGSPIANRNRTELEGLIGFFLNTLALRCDLSDNPSFAELLVRVRNVALDAYAHQDLPFEKLVEEIQPARSLSYSPLFQVMFVLQTAPAPLREFAGLTLGPFAVESETAKFDLTLSMREEAQGLRGFLEYNTDLFDAATIDRMIRHLERLLQGIVADPDQRISDLPLLSEAENYQFLVDWNNTKRDYPSNKCIHELFEEQARRSPAAVAVVYENQQLTYQELNCRANQLARYLCKLGIGPDSLVAIAMDRSLEMIVGLLGILKAGGAYVPLDPEYPQERLAFMLHDAQVRLLLTQRRLVDKLVEDRGSKPVLSEIEGMEDSDPESSILNPRLKVVCLDRDWAVIEKQSQENPETEATANNLAYVIYTSGSTGQPKGVAIEHRNAVAFLSWAHSAFSKEELSGVLASTPICFDLSVFEIFTPLTGGGTIIMAESALALTTIPNRSKVSLVNTVPSAINELLRLDAIPASVRVINLAGEPLAPELVRRIYESTSVHKVHDLYGPSESTTYSTWTCRSGDGPQTIGRPIANSRVYILDPQRNPVPIGVVGEIYIGGDGVARGYLHRPELTAERFIYHSFDKGPDQRLYKTGDLARYLPDGNIEFLGRTDDQVKIRGYRIELGEIETVLSRHPEVLEAVVVARNEGSGKRLVAYLIHGDGADVSVNELRRFLKQKLPDYMIPSAFVVLTTLPLMPNGKIDRRALPAPDQSRPELHAAFVAPRTWVEEKLAQIWRELLKVAKVGIHDNFFDLGGHSLLATQVIARICQLFEAELPVRSIFETPTIEGLASLVVVNQAKPVQQGNLEPLLCEVETMSDEEAAQHLIEESK